MPRYTIVEIKEGTMYEYGKRFALLKDYPRKKVPEDGIYIAQKVGKIIDKRGRAVHVLDKFIPYTKEIDLEEQHELYHGRNPEVAKKFLFLPPEREYGYLKIFEKNAINNCDIVNRKEKSAVYKKVHQRYLLYLLMKMND